jgi:hypothetical protein
MSGATEEQIATAARGIDYRMSLGKDRIENVTRARRVAEVCLEYAVPATDRIVPAALLDEWERQRLQAAELIEAWHVWSRSVAARDVYGPEGRRLRSAIAASPPAALVAALRAAAGGRVMSDREPKEYQPSPEGPTYVLIEKGRWQRVLVAAETGYWWEGKEPGDVDTETRPE